LEIDMKKTLSERKKHFMMNSFEDEKVREIVEGIKKILRRLFRIKSKPVRPSAGQSVRYWFNEMASMTDAQLQEIVEDKSNPTAKVAAAISWIHAVGKPQKPPRYCYKDLQPVCSMCCMPITLSDDTWIRRNPERVSGVKGEYCVACQKRINNWQ
jgi:hypothetical protein